MAHSRKKGRCYNLPTTAELSRVIRNVMNRSGDKDISEDDILKYLSDSTGISINYFKTHRKDILDISDEIANELGLERDSVSHHFDNIEAIILRCIFPWPAMPEQIIDRKKISFSITQYIVKHFEEDESNKSGSEYISLDDIYEGLMLEEYIDSVDPDLLAFGLVEVWDYLLEKSLIT